MKTIIPFVPFFPSFSPVPFFPVPLFPVPFFPCPFFRCPFFLCPFFLCPFYRAPFQSYCTSMYCSQLWFNSTKDSLRKLRTSYNTVLRRLLCISLPYSASQMFVSRGILTFDELLRKSVYNFAKRIERSTNAIISSCLSASIYLYSPIREW